jgi:hypothetical protein
MPLPVRVLSIQRLALDRVLHPLVLERVIDNEQRTAGAHRFRLAALLDGLRDSIWTEARAAAPDTASPRRALQRDHLRRMISMVTQGAGAPEDARTMARHTLKTLRAQLAAAQTCAADVATRARFEESAARIDEALKANITRSSF